MKHVAVRHLIREIKQVREKLKETTGCGTKFIQNQTRKQLGLKVGLLIEKIDHLQSSPKLPFVRNTPKQHTFKARKNSRSPMAAKRDDSPLGHRSTTNKRESGITYSNTAQESTSLVRLSTQEGANLTQCTMDSELENRMRELIGNKRKKRTSMMTTEGERSETTLTPANGKQQANNSALVGGKAQQKGSSTTTPKQTAASS